MPNKKSSITLSNLAALFIFSFVAYYLLLHENCMHSSITAIITYSHTISHNKHLVILALLPVYIAMMIFGAALLGIYTSSRLEFLLARSLKVLRR
jgi:hypothetical protein